MSKQIDLAERIREGLSVETDAAFAPPLYREEWMMIEKALRSHVIRITDEMCLAAINSDAPDCIKGSTYQNRYVIRDEWADKDIWSGPRLGALQDHSAFQRQVEIERMRRILEDALRSSAESKPRMVFDGAIDLSRRPSKPLFVGNEPQSSSDPDRANLVVLIQRLRAGDIGGLKEEAYQSLCGDAADALSRLVGQRSQAEIGK